MLDTAARMRRALRDTAPTAHPGGPHERAARDALAREEFDCLVAPAGAPLLADVLADQDALPVVAVAVDADGALDALGAARSTASLPVTSWR